MYRLDRTAFKIQSFEEASHNRAYWMQQPPAERFKAAWYLTCAAYGIDSNNPPRMDKTYFAMRKNGKHA